MAIFDPHEQRLCVRVVYDGVAGAGKTTNLRQLAALFASQRATEVYSPSELDGRTLFFDWMQLSAGAVSGIPLLCQIISVPGQVVLTPRRRHLLATADVIVYVCDSSASSIHRAREGLAIVDAVAKERGVKIPFVVQANKQDQFDALDCAGVLRALGRPGIPAIDAIATEGIGVVDTFVGAIRTLSRTIQDRPELRLDVKCVENRERALGRVASESLDPEWAAEMLLEEASSAFLVDALEERAAEHEAALPEEIARTGVPVLPSDDVPTGFIWPAHTGRATLRALATTGALGARPVVGPTGVVSHTAHGYVLRTNPSARYESAEAARQALVRAARERTQLERLLVPDTVVVAHSSGDGAWWIWTVMSEVTTLASRLAEHANDSSSMRELLDMYGIALVDAVRASVRHGFGLTMGPSAFGLQGKVIRYVGDILATPPANELADSVCDALVEIERASGDVGVVLAAFEREVERRLTQEELARTAQAWTPSARRRSEGAAGAAVARVHAMFARAGA